MVLATRAASPDDDEAVAVATTAIIVKPEAAAAAAVAASVVGEPEAAAAAAPAEAAAAFEAAEEEDSKPAAAMDPNPDAFAAASAAPQQPNNDGSSSSQPSPPTATQRKPATAPGAFPVPDDQRVRTVLILGAGVAGLAAARELRARGYQCLIVEARLRPGGRLKGGRLRLLGSHSSSSSSSNRNSNSTVHLDLGGALIHGIRDNPVYDLVHRQLRLPTVAVRDCLLLTGTGWPVEPSRDARVRRQFDDCLEATFQAIHAAAAARKKEEAAATTTTTTFAAAAAAKNDKNDAQIHNSGGVAAAPADNGHRRNGSSSSSSSSNKKNAVVNDSNHNESEPNDATAAANATNTDAAAANATNANTDAKNATADSPSSSFGAQFERVCRERRIPAQSDRALFRWYRANLEVSCGAGFPELGWWWNEDEPYGFDGDHVAVPGSWSAVCDALAEGVPVRYESAVRRVRVVEPRPVSVQTRSRSKRWKPTVAATAPTTTPTRNTRSSRKNPPTITTTQTELETAAENGGKVTSATTTTTTKAKEPNSTEGADAAVEPPPTTTATSNGNKIAVRTRTQFVASRKPKSGSGSSPTATAVPERWSRRLRGATTQTARRSLRANKGAGVDVYTVGHEDPARAKTLSRKRRRRSSSRDNDNKKAEKVEDTAAEQQQSQWQQQQQSWPNNTKPIVQVTLESGEVLQADAVICTIPLGVLKQSSTPAAASVASNDNGDTIDDSNNANHGPGGIQFDPPLPVSKQNAIQRLGTGLLNKCALTFATKFWQDSDFLGLADDAQSYLVLNASKINSNSSNSNNADDAPPCLLFMFGGAFAKTIEDWTDAEIVADCLAVLQRMCGQIRGPLVDYQVTRWGREPYSRMSFTYVPPGVDGSAELAAMGRPVCSMTNRVPVLMFAGEHTTPYHPSTIHGAFLSGIREAYRLDCLMDPDGNDGLEFSDQDGSLYQPTFRMSAIKQQRRRAGSSKSAPGSGVARARSSLKPAATSHHHSAQHRRRGAAAGTMTLRHEPKTVLPIETTAKTAPATSSSRRKESSSTTPKTSPSRRSQRSSTRFYPDAAAASTASAEQQQQQQQQPPAPTTDATTAVADIAALQDRTLLRSLESYGPDFAYLASTALPVYGTSFLDNRTAAAPSSWATSTLSPAQVQQRCRQLLAAQSSSRNRSRTSRRSNVNSNTNLQAWLAPRVAPPTTKNGDRATKKGRRK